MHVRIRLLPVVVGALAGGAAAGAAAPRPVPLPPERPPEVAGAPGPQAPGRGESETPAGGSVPGIAAGVPVPPERPPEFGAPAGAPAQPGQNAVAPSPAPPPAPGEGGASAEGAAGEPPPLPPERPAELEPRHEPKPPATTDEEQEACLARIRDLGLSFEPLPPIADPGGCGAPHPLRLSGLGEDVAVSPPATTTCLLAEALAHWARDVVRPAAQEGWQHKLTALRIGTSYQCRGQNHVATAKLSEHAYANGVDVAAFELGKTVISVGTQATGSPEEAFQKKVREGACPIFTTVLGPGTDPEHATHLHLDLRARKNGYRICE